MAGKRILVLLALRLGEGVMQMPGLRTFQFRRGFVAHILSSVLLCSLFVGVAHAGTSLAHPASPDCSALSLTEAQVHEAVFAQIAKYGSIDEPGFGLIVIAAAESLGCSVLGPLPDTIFASGFDVPLGRPAGDDFRCDFDYCSWAKYCGVSNSLHAWSSTVATSSKLNELCFEHDQCYARTCYTNLTCVFANNNVPTSACDKTLMDYCIFLPFSRNLTADYMVCEVVVAARQQAFSWCADDGAAVPMPTDWNISVQCDGGGGGSFFVHFTMFANGAAFNGAGTYGGQQISWHGYRICSTDPENPAFGQPVFSAPRGRGLRFFADPSAEPAGGITFNGRFDGDGLADPPAMMFGVSIQSPDVDEALVCPGRGTFNGIP